MPLSEDIFALVIATLSVWFLRGPGVLLTYDTTRATAARPMSPYALATPCVDGRERVMLAIGKLSAASVDYYTEQLSHSVSEDAPVLRGGGSDRRVDFAGWTTTPTIERRRGGWARGSRRPALIRSRRSPRRLSLG
jgi:hypothetical protein